MDTFNFLRYEPHCEDTDILGEANKRDHHSVSREISAGPSRSAPKETIVQTISPDKHGHDLKTHLQLMTAARRNRGYHSLTREKTVDPPRSPPKEPVVQNISPDDSEFDLNTQTQSMTASRRNRDYHSLTRKKTVDPPRSALKEPVVQHNSSDDSESDLMTQPHSLTASRRNRDYHSLTRKKTVDPPRSALKEPVVQHNSSDDSESDLMTQPHSLTASRRNRDYHSLTRKKTVDPPRSALKEPVVQHNSSDDSESDLMTQPHSLTGRGNRVYHSLTRKKTVDPPRSPPKEPVVQNISPDDSEFDLNTQTQSMTEAIKRGLSSFNKEHWEAPSRYAPTETMAQNGSPNEPTHLRLMTEHEILTEKSWAELFLEKFVAFYCEVENPNLEEVHIISHCSSSSAYSMLQKVFIDFADEVNKTHLQKEMPPPRPKVPKDSRTSNDTKQRAELCSPPTISQNKMQLPSHWTSVKATDVLQVPIDSKDTKAAIRDEYSMVKRDFDKTMSHAEIVSVKRIQNALLWEHYALQKIEMEIKAGGEGLVNEMHLYHGTTLDAVDLICHSNFDFRMAGERVGAKYGQGAYFAYEAGYSDKYAVTDVKNHKLMFVAKVLIGKTCLGESTYKKPPYLDDNDKKKGTYNTCVNDVSRPTIFCVFDKNQYYPEYLVEYKLETHV